jgi:hypothetical protein
MQTISEEEKNEIIFNNKEKVKDIIKKFKEN